MFNIFPLVSFRDPRSVWQHEPTFLLGEAVLILLTLLLARSVARNGREYVFVAVACCFGGAFVELYTILEPNISNFYHSMASVMTFGDREPLYMLCCYIFIQFMCLVLPRNMKLPPVAEASLAALLATYLFGVLDAVGMKFLWWTWHNGDPLYADRNMGVPIVSALWILCSTFCLSMLVRAILEAAWFRRVPAVLVPVLAAVAGPFATLVLMNIPMALSFHLLVTFLKFHTSVALFAMRLLCFSLLAYSLLSSRRSLRFAPHTDFFLQSLAYLAFFALVATLARPEHVRRLSISQAFGRDCAATESSFWGAFERTRFVCPEGIRAERDHYSLDCLDASEYPAEGSTFYTVCGVPIAGDWWLQAGYYFAASLFCVVLAQFAPASAATAAKAAKKRN